MKTFCIILVSLFFFTACHRQQEKTAVVMQNRAPIVIDFPAGVIIDQNKPQTNQGKGNVSFARKILSQHLIPLLDTTTGQMVFVKQNGDRITIDMGNLTGKYDIVLFDGVRNPVPLRIADLQSALDQIFNKTIDKKPNPTLTQNPVLIASPDKDSVSPDRFRTRLSNLGKHDNRIIISLPDTASKTFIARTIPGIEWVEQRVDTRTLLKINFENDLITYANTDRYFTNGLTFDLQAAWLSRSPVQKIMIPYGHKAFVTYNLSMVQDMYTPTDTRVAPKLHNDRPYASYLYFGFRKTTADPLRKLKLASQFDIGYLGPYSPGSYLQTLVHKTFPTNDVPQGWDTQINTDIILNYNFKAQKALVNKKDLTLLAGMDIKAGTMYNNAGAGLELQAGKAEPVFGLAENEHWPKSEYYFFVKTNVSFVAYNALLQGGMFNHNNVFTLKSDEIQHVVGNAEAGFHVRYKGVGIELAQHWLTPEYKGGLWHKWGRISLIFKV